MMISVKTQLASLAVMVAALGGCSPSGSGVDDYGTGTPTGGYVGAASNIGLPPAMQTCAAGLASPGCDKQAAGRELAQLSETQSVLDNFSSPTVGVLTMRFTADGLRYGTDVVSCEDIYSQAGAFDASVRPGAAADLGAFIKTISADQARMKGCS